MHKELTKDLMTALLSRKYTHFAVRALILPDGPDSIGVVYMPVKLEDQLGDRYDDIIIISTALSKGYDIDHMVTMVDVSNVSLTSNLSVL